MALAERGIRLFPLAPNTKIPMKDWEWMERNSSDPAVLEGWNSLPNMNWAAVTGPESGFFAIDPDCKNGRHGMDWYEQNKSHLPDTLEVKTPSKALHLYYLWPDFPIHKNNTGKLAPDVDILALGSYVVTPPSYASGGWYRFLHAVVPQISPASQWLLDQLRAIENGTRKSVGEQRTQSLRAGKIRHPHRVNALISYAGRLFNTGMDFEDFQAALVSWDAKNCDPPLGVDEVIRQSQCYYRWTRKPGHVPGWTPVEAEGEIVKRKFSQIERRPIQWLWKPYMAAGMITLLSGDPGIGKSFVALDRAAEVTRNGGFVLYLSIENPPEEVLAPRFEALKGNPEMIELIEGIEYGGEGDKQVRGITLRDLKILEKEIQCHENVQLIVIDPVQSYLGEKVDAHRSNETRPVLDGLTALCRRHGVAPLILRHCSKASTGKVLYRGLGSIDFTAAARSELIVGEQNGRMAMAHLKTNLSKRGPTLGYEIVESDGVMLYETGLFRWTGECDLKPEDLVDEEVIDEEQKSALEEAEAFLKELLASGPLDNKQVVSIGKDAGIAERTLKRAKARLKIKAVRSRTGWDWVL